MKPQVYIDPRPAEKFDRYHERVRTKGPDWVYPLARMILTPPTWLLYRSRAIGTENVPERGATILAPNHFSNFDHFFLGLFIRRRVQFMAKSQLYRFPIDFILSHGGTFPVMRGRHDEQAFVTAHLILSQGGVVGMYGEGGRSRTKQLREPKPGLGRLALESGVPVTPVAIHGSQDVREIKRLRFPKVTIQYGEPIKFEQILKPTQEQAQRASALVFGRIREMHEALQSAGRKGVLKALRERQRRGLTRTEPVIVRARELADDRTRTGRFKPDSTAAKVGSSHIA